MVYHENNYGFYESKNAKIIIKQGADKILDIK